MRGLIDSGAIAISVADLPGSPKANPLDLFAIKLDPQKPPPIIVSYTVADVMRYLDGHPNEWVQVEIKPDLLADFTENEISYLQAVGSWPPQVVFGGVR